MKKKTKTPMWDSSDFLEMAHGRFQESDEKSADAASRLISIVDDTSGPDVGAIVALIALGLDHLTVGSVRHGKLLVKSTDKFERRIGAAFEVTVDWSEVKIAFNHFYFPEHWDAGGTVV
jgi:hypothetical protein